MENLSKENFWNRLKEMYPDAVELFCNWIDKYKEEVGWNKLFNSDSDYQNVDGKNAPALKFHDLPFEFQNGIIARFDIECFNGILTGKGKVVYENGRDGYVAGFVQLFSDLDTQLKKQKN